MNTAPYNSDPVGAATLAVISAANKFNRWMYEEIKPHLKGEILELGSGTGNISEFILKDNFTTVLSDYNSAYTGILKKKFEQYSNLKEVLSINLQKTSFEKEYAALHNQFDTIVLLNVIEHLEDDTIAVANCKYMLKQGGKLILLAPAYGFLYCNLDRNLGHYRRYTIHSLAALLEKNKMTIIEKKYFNLAGISGWLIWGKLLNKPQLQQGTMKIFNTLVPVFRFTDQLFFKKLGLSAITTGKKL